jgi:hypothetical protein
MRRSVSDGGRRGDSLILPEGADAMLGDTCIQRADSQHSWEPTGLELGPNVPRLRACARCLASTWLSPESESEHLFDGVQPRRSPRDPARGSHRPPGEVVSGVCSVDELYALTAAHEVDCVLARVVATP